MGAKFAKRLFDILELTTPSDTVSRVFNIFMTSLISLNILAVILETVDDIAVRYGDALRGFEIVSIVVFTIEYVTRICTCTVDARFSKSVLGRVKYALTPLAIVDLAAIFPFYLPLLFPFDLRFVRALRLLRLFRMFKFGRYTKALKTLGIVLRNKREELLISAFVVLILLVISSSLMYYVEHDVQPEAFSSILSAMWWAVATLTTVGYGDVYPVTALGKLLGAVIALLGIGMFALPAGILATGFSEVIQKDKRRICPHCGKSID